MLSFHISTGSSAGCHTSNQIPLLMHEKATEKSFKHLDSYHPLREDGIRGSWLQPEPASAICGHLKNEPADRSKMSSSLVTLPIKSFIKKKKKKVFLIFEVREREIAFQSAGLHPRWPHQSRIRSYMQVFYIDARGPSTWTIPILFPGQHKLNQQMQTDLATTQDVRIPGSSFTHITAYLLPPQMF